MLSYESVFMGYQMTLFDVILTTFYKFSFLNDAGK